MRASSISSSDSAIATADAPLAEAVQTADVQSLTCADPELAGIGRGFPWALVLGLLIVLATELLLRQLEPRQAIPYELGLPEHHAVAAYLDAVGPAEVAFVGSSRAREAFICEEVRQCLLDAGLPPLSVANYGVSGARMDETESMVRYMLRQPRRPKLIVYGVTYRELAIDKVDWPRLAIFWNLQDWRRFHPSGDDAPDLLPAVLRNEIGRWCFNLRYRLNARLRAQQWFLGFKPVPCPIAGHSTPAHAEPPRSLLTDPVSPESVRRYLGRERLDAQVGFDGATRGYLTRMGAMCRAAGVPLVVCELPLPGVLEAQLPAGTSGRFRASMNEWSHASGVRFVAFEQLGLCMTDADFREQSHLNRVGATRMSRTTAVQVLAPTLRARADGPRDP